MKLSVRCVLVSVLLAPVNKLSAEIVTPTSATATSELFGATQLINGSGLMGEGEVFEQTHGTNVLEMWLSDFGSVANEQEIEFELDGNFDLSTAIVWQHNAINGEGNPTPERDLTELEIQVSPDLDSPFVTLDDFTLAPAIDPLDPIGEPPQFLVLDGAFNVRRVKFKVLSAAGGPDSQFVGLSEVRFDGERVGDAPVKTWTADSGGDWFNDFFWSPAAPNGAAESAIFGDAITSAKTIFMDQPVTVKAITFENANSYVLAGSESISFDSNNSNPRIDVRGGDVAGSHQFQAAVSLVDDTDVNVETGASLEFVNRLNLDGKTLTKTGAGTVTFSNALSAGGGMVDCAEGVCSGGGTIAGNLLNTATLAPGNSPGMMTVNGNFTQPTEGILAIELAGTVAGDEYDQLSVTEFADLAGGVSVSFLDGFEPAAGARFEIVTSSEVIDNGIVLVGDNRDMFQLSLTATSVFLEVIGEGGLACDFDGSGSCDIGDLDELLYSGISTGDAKYDLDGSGTVDLGDRDAFLSELGTVPGDFDLDQKVGASDLNILGSNWTQDVTSYSQGDANGDGMANATDLNLVGSNWQFDGSAAARSTSAVPEPSIWHLLLVGIGSLVLYRRRR